MCLIIIIIDKDAPSIMLQCNIPRNPLWNIHRRNYNNPEPAQEGQSVRGTTGQLMDRPIVLLIAAGCMAVYVCTYVYRYR